MDQILPAGLHMSESPSNLWQVLHRFRLSEILGWDLLTGLMSAGGAIWLVCAGHGSRLIDVAPVAVGLAGITVTAVIASIAIMVSFMDPQFLRNLAAIDREPTRYMAPLLATVILGVVAALFGLVLSALSPTAPSGWLSSVGAGTTLFTVWAMTSLVRGLSTLVQFVQLHAKSAAVPDE